MNKHLSEGELRASLDMELEPDQLRHLQTCADCQTRQRTMQVEQTRVAKRLAFLTPGSEPVPAAKTAWSRFQQRLNNPKEISMLKKWFSYPVVRFGAALTLILALVLAFPTTRALASEFLNLFRVEQVKVLPIDTASLENMKGSEALSNQLGQMMTDSVVVTKESGDPVTVTDLAAAKETAEFDVRLPQGMTPNEISVRGGSSFSFTFNRAKVQAFLNEAGRNDLALPESADGAKIIFDLFATVQTSYGTCPKPVMPTDESEQGAENVDENMEEVDYESYKDCLVFAQAPSPEINSPSVVNLAELAQLGLELTGMSSEEAIRMTNTIDWTSTLVVPMPSGKVSTSDVSVDGVTGSLVTSKNEYDGSYVLIWVKNGVVYFISGRDNSALALELAQALP